MLSGERMKSLGEAAVRLLAEAGIRVTLNPAGSGGWGWWLESVHLHRAWDGPYESTWDAAQAAFTWLLLNAAAGVHCEATHSDVATDALEPWYRAFAEKHEGL